MTTSARGSARSRIGLRPGRTVLHLRLSLGPLACLGLSFWLAASCAGKPAPIRGEKRDELCQSLVHAPSFHCPAGTHRRGKPPPDGTEMWCQRWDGTRHGSYRRFPPGAAAGAVAPDFVIDGTVIGEYREGAQHGAWWTRRAGAGEINVAYYEDGALRQRVHCRP